MGTRLREIMAAAAEDVTAMAREAVASALLADAGGTAATPMAAKAEYVEGSIPHAAVPKEFTALKVTFYELLLRQLHDDGFAHEAEAIARKIRIEPDARVGKDALVEAYGKALKFAFGDEPQAEWAPVRCTPVPALGAQERILDLDAAGGHTTGAGGSAEAGAVPGAVSGATGGEAVTRAAGAVPGGMQPTATDMPGGRRVPEVRLLYTAAHRQACRSAAFSQDGRFCATGCADGSIKILDSEKMRTCAAASSGPMGRARITEEELNKPVVRTLHDHLLGVTCLAFHPVNPTLFSGSLDKSVKIFDLTRPPGHKKAFSVLQDVHPVRCLSIHPCGDFLLVGASHPAIRLYDLQTLNCFTTFRQDHHHTGAINDVRCTSDGRCFASASNDGTVKIWDAVSQRVANNLPRAHSGSAVLSCRWSRSTKYLLTSGADGRTRLFDVRMGRELFCMGFGPRSCEFSNSVFVCGERFVASANSNVRSSDVSLFDAATGSPMYMKLGMHLLPVHALDSAEGGKGGMFMTGCDDDKARYFSVEARE